LPLRWRGPSKDGDPSAIGRQGTTDRVAGTARRRRLNIFTLFHSRLYFMPVGTQRRCAMWRMSNAQALIFIAVVVIMGALRLLA
jgi:hypothetical protein